MKGCFTSLAIAVVVIAIPLAMLASAVLGQYNTMVTQRVDVETAWAQVETQYQRRFDLIPNLANSVKGFLDQERSIMESIADARTRYAGSPSGSKKQIEAAGELEGFLSRLLMVVENYPDLKSDATVQSLMDELTGTENRVNVARIRYNEVARDYNVLIKRFPASLIAGVFNFEEKVLFESKAGADAPPVVDLLEVEDVKETQ